MCIFISGSSVLRTVQRALSTTNCSRKKEKGEIVYCFFVETCENEKLDFSVNIASMVHVSPGHRMCFPRGSPGAARETYKDISHRH